MFQAVRQSLLSQTKDKGREIRKDREGKTITWKKETEG